MVAVKICGLSDEWAVRAAITGRAAYLGFVFYPPSPRAVTAAEAARLGAMVPAGISRVGLFVDAADETIAAILAAVPLDLLQFHGNETPQRVAAARARFGRKIIKAVPVGDRADLVRAAEYQDAADLLLFDARPPRDPSALPGGNGLAFDWSLLAGHEWRRPWLLSGGLTTELLADAVRLSGAVCVDVSSGVESARGRKDPGKIKAFLAAADTL
ncbi:MAG TPA: phosphoribosylanthranilate isomerase [Stellaceae bacterium]|nr:phosphoribosylanthranilate isomerase [Stellaceae bacterium]